MCLSCCWAKTDCSHRTLTGGARSIARIHSVLTTREPPNHVYYPWWGCPSGLTATLSDLAGAGGKELEEIELDHLDGHKGSR